MEELIKRLRNSAIPAQIEAAKTLEKLSDPQVIAAVREVLDGLSEPAEENSMANNDIEILAEHYQKSFEVAYETWKQRNKLFLWLLGLVSSAVLLTFQAPQANPLLVDWLAKLVGVTGSDEIKAIRDGFPFALLHSALGFAIFYMMVNVYQHSRIIRQNNYYLPRLERDLRKKLELEKGSVFFTREGRYITPERSKDGIFIAWTYVVSLGFLLAAFITGRVIEDARLKNPLLIFIDSLLCFLIAFYFWLYARGSVGLERDKVKKTITFEDFQSEINSIFQLAEKKHLSEIALSAGQLHTLVAGPPAKSNQLELCSTVLNMNKQEGDEVIEDVLRGGPANWTIRYRFPRKSNRMAELAALMSSIWEEGFKDES